jgi:putative transposase
LVKKKDGTSGLSTKEKTDMIESNHPELNIQEQCELINLPRSNYYRGGIEAKEETEENRTLMRLIAEEYAKRPFLGSRKLVAFLKRLGKLVNRKRVQRLMQLMGIQSVAPKPNTSKRNKAHPVYPYLLKKVEIERPNHVWSTDITYIKLNGSFVYLVAIIDWYSRKVLSWELSNTMETEFCISALERAIRLHGVPEIFNTDQGSQFTSESFTDVLKNNNIKISMDGKGRWQDNILIERLWRSVKYEEIYLKEYASLAELQKSLKSYFHYYNEERTHQSLDYKTPTEIYTAALKKAA